MLIRPVWALWPVGTPRKGRRIESNNETVDTMENETVATKEGETVATKESASTSRGRNSVATTKGRE